MPSMFDSLNSIATEEHFRIFSGGDVVKINGTGDALADAVFTLLESEYVTDQNGQRIEAVALLMLPVAVTFDLTGSDAWVTVGSERYEVIGEVDRDSTTRTWAMRRYSQQTVNAIPHPSRRFS